MGFSKFQLSPELFQSITTLGYAEPTPIQDQVIPKVLEGKDIQACAQTGTGKTCAFAVPIVEKLIQLPRGYQPRALILTPTRELAVQVMSVFHDLSKSTRIKSALLIGGANFGQQLRQIKAGAEIVVATPGRLMDHLKRRTIRLSDIQFFVLDEADRMLDMGFLPSIRIIVAALPQRRQSMLFSATYSREIQELIRQFLTEPAVVEIERSKPSQNVTQMIYPVSRQQKVPLLQAILELGNMTSALVFTRTKNGANKLSETLEKMGKSVSVIHGNKSQNARQNALQGFKDRRYQILVATDIAARGIDVKDISHVINFDVPVSPEDYVHRIGRTGRAQAVGEAFTLVSPDEERQMRDIERLIGKKIPRGVIPDFPYHSQPKVFSNQPKERAPHHHNRPEKSFHRPAAPGAPHHGAHPAKPEFNRPKEHGSSQPKQGGFDKFRGNDNRPHGLHRRDKKFQGYGAKNNENRNSPYMDQGGRDFFFENRGPKAGFQKKKFFNRDDRRPGHFSKRPPFGKSKPWENRGPRDQHSDGPSREFNSRPSREPQSTGGHFLKRKFHGGQRENYSGGSSFGGNRRPNRPFENNRNDRPSFGGNPNDRSSFGHKPRSNSSFGGDRPFRDNRPSGRFNRDDSRQGQFGEQRRDHRNGPRNDFRGPRNDRPQGSQFGGGQHRGQDRNKNGGNKKRWFR